MLSLLALRWQRRGADRPLIRTVSSTREDLVPATRELRSERQSSFQVTTAVLIVPRAKRRGIGPASGAGTQGRFHHMKVVESFPAASGALATPRIIAWTEYEATRLPACVKIIP